MKYIERRLEGVRLNILTAISLIMQTQILLLYLKRDQIWTYNNKKSRSEIKFGHITIKEVH